MRKLYFIFIVLITTLFTSCNKCDPSNSSSGLIVEDAIIRVIGNSHTGGVFISDATEYSSPIEMSLDGGVSYTNVDYSKYSVFSLITTSSCSSGYNRSVVLDAINETVNYTIEITECSTCTNLTTIGNWVLTSKVPSNYAPVFSVK
ncbi:MAG TPA: hypothetical protein VFD77_09045 [Brumimicrobium sp.]|nr:hypothetical protein [Brumimicrobium sp.]